MKSFISLLGIVVLIHTATVSFAQVNPLEVAVKTASQVERITQQSISLPAVVRNAPYLAVKAPIPQPSGNIMPNAPVTLVKLYDVRIPVMATITPVNISLIEKTIRLKAQRYEPSLAMEWVERGGKALYQSQQELAEDLHAFYRGKGYRRLKANGDEVLYYMLPVDGIVYQPLGRRPVALEASRDFMIYYPAEHTGQLASNEPMIWNLFHPADAPVSEAFSPDLIGQEVSVKFPLEARAIQIEKTHMMLEANRARRGEQRQANLLDERWQKIGGKTQYASQRELGKDLFALYGKDAPKFVDLFSKQTGYLYELPVKNILYKPEGSRTFELDPEKQVIFVTESGNGQIVDRTVFENPVFYRWIP